MNIDPPSESFKRLAAVLLSRRSCAFLEVPSAGRLGE
jgi:hypothetical protein